MSNLSRSDMALDHDAHIDKIITAMATAGQKLALHWGHEPWSDSWANLVAQEMLKALESTDEPIYVKSEVAGEDAVFCGDCCGPAGSSCDYHGHGLATLGELLTSYSNGGAR